MSLLHIHGLHGKDQFLRPNGQAGKKEYALTIWLSELLIGGKRIVFPEVTPVWRLGFVQTPALIQSMFVEEGVKVSP